MDKYTNETSMFIEETISYHSDRRGFVDIDALPDHVIKEFASICMEFSDDEITFLTEADQSDITNLIVQNFKKEDDDTLFDLDEYISNEAIKYYKPILEEMLTSLSLESRQIHLEDNGFHIITDKDNGENHWVNGSRRAAL